MILGNQNRREDMTDTTKEYLSVKKNRSKSIFRTLIIMGSVTAPRRVGINPVWWDTEVKSLIGGGVGLGERSLEVVIE